MMKIKRRSEDVKITLSEKDPVLDEALEDFKFVRRYDPKVDSEPIPLNSKTSGLSLLSSSHGDLDKDLFLQN